MQTTLMMIVSELVSFGGGLPASTAQKENSILSRNLQFSQKGAAASANSLEKSSLELKRFSRVC